MCGIYGWVKKGFEDNEQLKQMGDLLSHRGPDDQGFYEDGTVCLGHRRLSIIDLSRSGRQPMSNEDGSVMIVLNGEIYNFLELRDKLSHEHTFKSKTDTEVLLHLYEEKGEELLSDINGMFAFAIWDKRKRQLFLARDRFGKKPLYYYSDGTRFLFASEINSILSTGNVDRKVSGEAIHDYLSYQYIPAPQTIIEGVRKLMPGNYIIWKDGKFEEKNYWRLSFDRKADIDEERIEEELFERFERAVRLRLVSDVPLGAFLSGGVDSSAVVAAMSREMKGTPPRTFTIGFDYETYNEIPYAKIVSTAFGTDHTEFIVTPDAVSLLPRLVEYYGEPFADSSAIPTYYVSKICRESVTVVLSGDGGDELFCGYPRYAHIKSRPAGEKVPLNVRNQINRLAAKIPRNRRGFCRLRRTLDGLGILPELSYFDNISYFLSSEKEDLYSDGFRDLMRGRDSFDYLFDLLSKAGADSFTERLMEADVNSYLPNDLLVKVDIASMANSLEVRAPFLDYEFAEFVCSLPLSLKLKNGESKWILKKILSKYLPGDLIYRKKMGFGVPLKEWFRKELKTYAADILLSRRSLARGYFKRGSVESLLEDHFEGRRDNAYKIYALLFLELWMLRFMDGKSIS